MILKENPNSTCLISQEGVIGSGYNLRNVDHMIVVDLPMQNSDLIPITWEASTAC